MHMNLPTRGSRRARRPLSFQHGVSPTCKGSAFALVKVSIKTPFGFNSILCLQSAFWLLGAEQKYLRALLHRRECPCGAKKMDRTVTEDLVHVDCAARDF